MLVINGPNLNFLGLREPALYGARNFAALQDFIRSSAAAIGVDVELFQSNHEGAIVDAIQAAYGVFDAILINPAAYTHTSVAILDALKAVALPGGGTPHRYIHPRGVPPFLFRFALCAKDHLWQGLRWLQRGA